MWVFLGENIIPNRYRPMVDLRSETDRKEMVEGTRRVLDNSAAVLLAHAEYIAKTCAVKAMQNHRAHAHELRPWLYLWERVYPASLGSCFLAGSKESQKLAG